MWVARCRLSRLQGYRGERRRKAAGLRESAREATTVPNYSTVPKKLSSVLGDSMGLGSLRRGRIGRVKRTDGH